MPVSAESEGLSGWISVDSAALELVARSPSTCDSAEAASVPPSCIATCPVATKFAARTLPGAGSMCSSVSARVAFSAVGIPFGVDPGIVGG